MRQKKFVWRAVGFPNCHQIFTCSVYPEFCTLFIVLLCRASVVYWNEVCVAFTEFLMMLDHAHCKNCCISCLQEQLHALSPVNSWIPLFSITAAYLVGESTNTWHFSRMGRTVRIWSHRGYVSPQSYGWNCSVTSVSTCPFQIQNTVYQTDELNLPANEYPPFGLNWRPEVTRDGNSWVARLNSQTSPWFNTSALAVPCGSQYI